MQWLTNRFGDRYIHEVNRDAFVNNSAEDVYGQFLDEQILKADTLYFIVGTDSGLLIRHLLNKGVPEGSRYLFVEDAGLLPELDETLQGLDTEPAVRLTTIEQWTQHLRDISFDGYTYHDSVTLLNSLGAMDAHHSPYSRIYWDLRCQVDQKSWEVRTQLGNRIFIQSQLQNLAENRTDATHLQDRFEGRTAMIMAGGPTLDEFIPWAIEHRDSVVLIAVSRISRRLAQKGLQPHIIVSVDPQSISFSLSKEMLEMDPEQVLFANSYHVAPQLLGQWRGRSVFLGRRVQWKSKLNVEGNAMGQGPTVTNSAFGLARYMGFSRIVLAGVDFCHSRDGHTHAKGSNERKLGPLLNEAGIVVKTNGGWLAETSPDYFSSMNTLAAQVKHAAALGVEVINPAEGSAEIEQVDHRPIGEVPVERPVEPVADTLFALLPRENGVERAAHYQRCLKDLKKTAGQLKRIRKLAVEALECNDGLFGRNGKPADFKYKKRMDKIEKRLDREYKDLAPMVKQMDLRRFLRLTQPRQFEAEEWSDDELEEWGRAYYEAYRDGTDAMLEMLEETQDRLQSRLEEEAEQPDFPVITKQWGKDLQFGRALLWRSRREAGGLAIPEEAEQPLATAEKNFHAIQKADDPILMLRQKKRRSLSSVPGKAWHLFRTNDRDALEQLKQSLAEIGSDEAKLLALLASGYLCELDRNFNEAMGYYEEIVDQHHSGENADGEPINEQSWASRILEDALLQISTLSIQLNNAGNALLSLDCLSSMSPAYQPQYAELLKLTGNADKALDVYADYLEQVPDDLNTLVKLGKLYAELGSNDAARQVCEMVLSRDPGHKPAASLLESTETRH